MHHIKKNKELTQNNKPDNKIALSPRTLSPERPSGRQHSHHFDRFQMKKSTIQNKYSLFTITVHKNDI